MPRPKGEPTKVVRLFVPDADWLIQQAAANDVSVAVAFVALREHQRGAPRPQRTAQPPVAEDDGRCHCATPTLSKHASTVCTTCHRRR